MKILSDAEDIKDIPSLEIVQNLISKVVAKTVPCDNEVITENYKLGTNVQTALSNLLTYTYVNASGISQLSTSLQSAWDTINSISSTSYTGGSGIVVSGSVIGHSNNLTAEGTVNTGEIQTPDFGENATLTWFKYDKQGHVTFTGTGGIKIPTADTTLSSTSTRPISSKAVYDNLKASVIRATTKTVGSGSGAVSIYDDVQETLESFQSHIYKLHTDITSLDSAVGVLNTYKDSINISAGSKTVPVYFNNGVPTVCQYTLGSICTKSTSDYLPITGGTLTDKLTVNSDIVIPNAKAVADNTVPVAGSLATITDNDFTQLKNYKSIIGSIRNSTDNVWYDVISVRHRNGYNDGGSFGMYLYSKLASSGDLIWNKQTASSKWQGERTIVDSGNYTTYFKNSASNIAGTGLEYVEGTDSSGKPFIKINHKKGSKSSSIGPDPTTYTPNFGETFDVGYAQYDDTGHIIMSSTATIKLPEYSALKNPFALTIQGNGTKLVTYDGAGPVTLNITPSSIGAATSSHTHSGYASSSHTHPYLPLSGGNMNANAEITMSLSADGRIGKATCSGYRYKVPSSGGFSCGDYWYSDSSFSKMLGGIGAFGNSGSLSYFFVGGKYSNPLLKVDISGNVVAKGSITGSGADYTEFWEMEDGNLNNEDLRGFFVTVNENNKILKANEGDYILGVISSTPVIIGNEYPNEWKNKYLKDVYGNHITVENEVDGVKTTEFVINPEYDPDREYVNRSNRKEWQIVGLIGQLIANDDGTSKPGSFCKVKDGGIATSSDSGYRVLERIDDSHIKILFR